jgi:hypothetical protein
MECTLIPTTDQLWNLKERRRSRKIEGKEREERE